MDTRKKDRRAWLATLQDPFIRTRFWKKATIAIIAVLALLIITL